MKPCMAKSTHSLIGTYHHICSGVIQALRFVVSMSMILCFLSACSALSGIFQQPSPQPPKEPTILVSEHSQALQHLQALEQQPREVEVSHIESCGNTSDLAQLVQCKEVARRKALADKPSNDELLDSLNTNLLQAVGLTKETIRPHLTLRPIEGQEPQSLPGTGYTENENKTDVLYTYRAKVTVKVQMSNELKAYFQGRTEKPLSLPTATTEPVPIPTPAPERPKQHETILRFCGSDTIGEKLVPELVKAFLEEKLEATDIKEDPPGIAAEKTIVGTVGNTIKTIVIRATGSSDAFTGLEAGTCDMGMASRRIKETDPHFLDLSSPASEHVLGLDGIAVIVDRNNPIRDLSIRQIGDIFTGKITDWTGVKGQRGPVRVYARKDSSGTRDIFDTLVLRGKSLGPQVQTFSSRNDLFEAISANPKDAIGYTAIPYVEQLAERGLKAIAVSNEKTQPLFPTYENVATEDYPLSRRLYLYIPGISDNPYLQAFKAFALSTRGQEIVKKAGSVDLNIKTFVSRIDPDLPAQNRAVFEKYRQAVDGAERLSLNFRFQTEKSDLNIKSDTRALQDMNRVVEFLQGQSGREIILVGFADSRGTYQYNLNLALQRAKTVAEEFKRRGIDVHTVLSASEEAPVASNATPLGRKKNRRTEIWIR